MKKKHIVLELPEQKDLFDKILSDENHQILNTAFSSVLVDKNVKHFALVVWHDYEYGDHMA